ncbi:acetyl/propionyl/methylcrotonyl-CoA carboxylase subunit alpha [Mycolicibacter virginiensis]|uniref:biotin carboxylase n=1 Tax=Mycolicibacter virginiensis TaxID=1795032 RepID=A0A9X7IPR2_9MYCO|nr:MULTISPECIES: acetyl/propionyl/methylcrotonyl-CoA carboxylase subunit alpha [Mycobacteriaceae]PQM53102.1 acetyl/propionyl/methylcrotonyl-CoA carboxylase subunit alpha [Mycolicibacter virginiensis]ULP49787.1 acetyl/propionyl/methylcrotonyl-CoA carboxylase subunit alpha [Mycolicibacter virginiensis]
MFKTVLIANRGEIAVRVIRTLRRMGIRSVAVYSDADAGARHVREADTAVRLGPAPVLESYLSIPKVLEAAAATGAQAIHPGYGFLSENAGFAAACERAGVVFIGPPARAIEVMGDKISAKNTVTAFEVPVVPGIAKPGLSDDELVAAAGEIGYPVLIKPSAGGGGKGMHLVEEPAGLRAALATARREAASAFGDDTLFLERFVLRPRHIEVQVLADTQGNVVHLGERECSLQRRHQKVIEEAPSPLLDAATRDRIGTAACNTARSVDYVGAGTVEFIVSADRPDEFFFMEMNTRLQVEHPVTEAITGLDLVEWQVRVAAGEKLSFTQDDITFTGHAVEARVYAEDPARGFLPTGGRVLALHEPTGAGVRVDSSLQDGTVVGSDYDPMLSKVIAHGCDRAQALARLDAALAGTAVFGVQTNVEFLRFLLADERVVAGDLDTELLDARSGDFTPVPAPDDVLAAGGLYRQWELAGRSRRGNHRSAGETAPKSLWGMPSGWRIGAAAPVRTEMHTPLRTETVSVWGLPDAAQVQIGDGEIQSASAHVQGDQLIATVAGRQRRYLFAENDGQLWISDERGTWQLREAEVVRVHRGGGTRSAEIASPMPGTVIAVSADSESTVSEGDPVVVVEAMKMEHTLTAPISGRVQVLVAVGEQVKVDQVLARLIPEEETEEAKS